MRKYSVLFLTGLTLMVFSLYLSSCKKDEEPFVKPKLSFTDATSTVNEADGTIQIEIKLDKPTIEDFTISYQLKGTAVDKVTAGTTSSYDYEITSDYLEVTILKGESIGIIEIKLYSDLSIEDDETIEIDILSTDSDNIEITRDDSIEITIKQEDGLLVILDWNYPITDSVDMDLFLWAEDTNGTLGLTSLNSVNVDYEGPEGFFLPTAILDDGTYGLSCNYYEGKVEPMNFEVSYIEVISGNDASTTTRSGSYTLANINPWDDATNGTDPLLEFTFEKLGADFKDFSEINLPTAGSRMKSVGDILKSLKRQNNNILPSARLKSIIKGLKRN